MVHQTEQLAGSTSHQLMSFVELVHVDPNLCSHSNHCSRHDFSNGWQCNNTKR